MAAVAAARWRAFAALLALLALHSFPVMAIDEPSFQVVSRQDPFELRDYRGYVVAQTFVDGAFDDAGNEAFRRLFRYISGANQGQVQIRMTAPVEQEAASRPLAGAGPLEQQRVGERWRIAFVLPPGQRRAGRARRGGAAPHGGGALPRHLEPSALRGAARRAARFPCRAAPDGAG